MSSRDLYLCLDDISLVPRYSDLDSRSECDVRNCGYRIPVIASPMDTVYSPELDRCLAGMRVPIVVHRYFKDAREQLASIHNRRSKRPSSRYRFFAVGRDKEWIDYLYDHGVVHFCCDFAHGDSKPCIETIEHIQSKAVGRSKVAVMAGNVATKSGFRHLENAGASMVRVGIGSGSGCSTRKNTGFGVPLLSSLEDAYDVRDKALIIADGGIKDHGDIAKYMAYGADLCMVGRLFAATFSASSEKFDNEFNVTADESEMYWAWYRGMASRGARSGIKKRASVEGAEGYIRYWGKTDELVVDIEENLKGSLSYAGVNNWRDFRRYAKDVRVSVLSLFETLTHVLTP